MNMASSIASPADMLLQRNNNETSLFFFFSLFIFFENENWATMSYDVAISLQLDRGII